MTPANEHYETFSARGITIDPTKYGYQILYNYESIYWRSLVGRDAWSLYEVLRTFCQTPTSSGVGEQQPTTDTCWPSLQTIIDILGYSDRRAIIKKIKAKNGSPERMGGLIGTLQEYGLVATTEKTKAGRTHYDFEVLLHPPQLTSEEVSKLCGRLQIRHEKLLERCEEAAKKRLESIEKTKALAKANQAGNTPVRSTTWDESHVLCNSTSVSNRPNITQSSSNITAAINTPTSEQTGEEYTDNRSPTGGSNAAAFLNDNLPVLQKLKAIGVGQKQAVGLVNRYPESRIIQKIEYLKFRLKDKENPLLKPSAWIVSAVRDDYKAPPGYISDEDKIKLEEQKRRKAIQAKWDMELAQKKQEAYQKRLAESGKSSAGTNTEQGDGRPARSLKDYVPSYLHKESS